VQPIADRVPISLGRVSYFPNDVIDRGVATATAKSDWNANGHIPGRLLRVDMTLVRAVNCSLQLEGLQALTDNQPARLSAVVSCVSCAVCPVAITALMVTRLRALGAISGHSHRSRNSTSVVYRTTPGMVEPNCSWTNVRAAPRRLIGSGATETAGS
jgi:hypothetical protein